MAPSQPASFAASTISMTSSGVTAPAPPITGTRPFAAATQSFMTRLRSSMDCAQNSPVQPLVTRPAQP